MKSILLLFLLLAAPVPGPCAPEPETEAQDSFAGTLTEKMPGLLAAHKVPGAVVSYIRNGDVAWTKAFGVANLETGARMQPDMVFNHGSDGKVLTAWGVMRLVEAGRVELDAPANRYLKRWKISSDKFDPEEVTVRRLLSHTAGMSVPGFSDYKPGAQLPSLVEVLDGKNQSNGAVYIRLKPGSTKAYSGGGFAILQMVIEDVTGEPFATFMEREVVNPLRLSSLQWTWTPELQRRAPVPYGREQKDVGYRQLAAQAVGSEVCTVSDFARFVAAAVSGPHGEAPGRGVLKPDTIAQMLAIQPNAKHVGLGYGIELLNGEKFLVHTGMNPGWTASFRLEVKRREGLVIANNSSRGAELNDAVEKLWLRVSAGTK